MGLYVEDHEFKEWLRLGSSDTVDDVQATLVLDAAHRAVDFHCGRGFAQTVDAAGTATARLYSPSLTDVAFVDDFWTTTSLVVETQAAPGGTWQTWDPDDFQVEPLNGIWSGVAGFPYWRIRAVRGRRFPCTGHASLRVTAKWGWSSVPDEVKTATTLQATRWIKRREAPFGTFESADGVQLRAVALDGDVMLMLAPYVKVGRILPVG